MTELEHKRVQFDLEDVSDEGVVTGYASVFGNIDSGNDVVMPGAFSKFLSGRGEKPVKMLWNHVPSFPIGKWTRLEEDEKGLWVEGKLTLASPKAQEIHALIVDGVVDSMSIGYRTIDAEDAGDIRKLKELELWEVSMVTFPMNSEARIAEAKSLTADDLRNLTERDFEAILTGKRDAVRLSRTAAQLLMKGGFSAFHNTTRDAGEEKAVSRMLESVLHEIRSMKETDNGT